MPSQKSYTTPIKTCSTCGETKAAEQFFKDKTKKDGLRKRCISCEHKKRKRVVEQTTNFAWLTKAANDNAKYKPKKLNCEKRYPGKLNGSQTKNPY